MYQHLLNQSLQSSVSYKHCFHLSHMNDSSSFQTLSNQRFGKILYQLKDISLLKNESLIQHKLNPYHIGYS